MSTVLWAGAVDGSPEYQSKILRHGTSAGLGVADPDRLFGARQGVRPGVTDSIITLSASEWAVAAHPGVIDAADAVDQGAYEYDFSGASGALQAADSSNPRVDRLDMQFVQGDGTTTNDTIQVKYTVGVPASNPVAPTAPGNSFPLIEIQVPKSGGGTPTFTWTAPTLDDTGWVKGTTAGGVVGMGYSSGGGRIVQYDLRRVGVIVVAYIRYTMPATNVNSTGDLSNVAVVQVTDQRFVPSMPQGLASGGSGRVAGHYIDTDGKVYLCSVGGGGVAIATDDPFSVAGVYFLG